MIVCDKVNYFLLSSLLIVSSFQSEDVPIRALAPLTHKVPGFYLWALNCCLTLKLCVCFQKYKLTSYEKKIWSKSQNVSEILRFENFMDLRFRHDLTHKYGRNSLNF